MKSLFTLALTLLTGTAFALPLGTFNALEATRLKSFEIDPSYDFEGIVKLSNCSGALVTFNGMPISAKAVVMTNGHCLEGMGGFLKPGQVVTNKAMSRSMKLYDKNFKLHTISATKIIYATMTNTDVALYELNETYSQVMTRTNVRPFMLDGSHPKAGTSIDIISGYWDRGYSCEIDGFVYKLKEADWTFTNSVRYTAGCDTIGGTSGSPIIERGTRNVIAINNTSNESGRRCTMNNPCEVNQQGDVEVKKGVRYGQQTFNIYTCLTPDFRVDVRRAGCDLPK